MQEHDPSVRGTGREAIEGRRETGCCEQQREAARDHGDASVRHKRHGRCPGRAFFFSGTEDYNSSSAWFMVILDLFISACAYASTAARFFSVRRDWWKLILFFS